MHRLRGVIERDALPGVDSPTNTYAAEAVATLWRNPRMSGDVTGDSGGNNPSEGLAGENPVLMERRPRHSREEIRVLLLETGRSILREEGPGSGAEVVTFKKVLERLEEEIGIRLTNASVIRRVWENQAEFQADLLVTIALEENQEEIDLTVGAVVPILSDADLTTVESRHAVMRELCRVGGAANLQAMRLSDNWPLWISVWGIARTAQPVEEREKIRAALLAGYDAFNDRIEDAYLAITALLGFRLTRGSPCVNSPSPWTVSAKGLDCVTGSTTPTWTASSGRRVQAVPPRNGPSLPLALRASCNSSSRSIRAGSPTLAQPETLVRRPRMPGVGLQSSVGVDPHECCTQADGSPHRLALADWPFRILGRLAQVKHGPAPDHHRLGGTDPSTNG